MVKMSNNMKSIARKFTSDTITWFMGDSKVLWKYCIIARRVIWNASTIEWHRLSNDQNDPPKREFYSTVHCKLCMSYKLKNGTKPTSLQNIQSTSL